MNYRKEKRGGEREEGRKREGKGEEEKGREGRDLGLVCRITRERERIRQRESCELCFALNR